MHNELGIFRPGSKTKEYWIKFGVDCYTIKRYEEAIEACNCALHLDSSYARAYHGKGLALAQLKRYGEALEAFEQACTLTPNTAKVHADMGSVLYLLKNYQRAGIAYRKASELDSKYHAIYIAKKRALVEYANRLYDPHYHYSPFLGDKKYADIINAYKSANFFDPEDTYIRSILLKVEPKQPVEQKAVHTPKPLAPTNTQPGEPAKPHTVVERSFSPSYSHVHPFNCTCAECYEF